MRACGLSPMRKEVTNVVTTTTVALLIILVLVIRR